MSIQSEIERISTNVQNTISTIADTGVSVASDANSDDLPALAAALANEKFPKSGGTITGNVLLDNSSSAQSGEPNIKWGTRSSNTPYIGFASDQTDGTFLLGSLKGTTYQTGLAIGGGSGNLLWKGTKVATTSDIPAAYTHPTTSGNKHIPSGGSSGQILRWSADGTAAWGSDNNSDTKNTAGSTNSSSKLFLVGATSQAANPQTYSHDTAYVGTDGYLYSNSEKVNPRICTTMIPVGTEITANTNLNTTALMKVGNYYCSANTTVATLTNCPTTSAFMMQVYSPLSTTIDNETTKTWIYRVRKMLVYTGVEFIQYCYVGGTAGSWIYGDWIKIIKATDTATTSAAGAMSAADKVKLNGVEAGANNYSLPTASSSTLGGVKTTSTVTSSSGYTPCPIISGVPYYKDTNTTYDNIPKTTTVTVSAAVSANTETAISVSYSSIANTVGQNGTILLTFFCGITASSTSSAVTKAVPTYGNIGMIDRVRVLSTQAQTINVCIGVIYR